MELKLKKMLQDIEASKLLIVPYGIETNVSIAFFLLFYPFNRTLWN